MPENRLHAYHTASENARSILREKDMSSVAHNTGEVFNDNLTVSFLNEDYTLLVPSFELLKGGQSVKPMTEVLVLRYLANSVRRGETGRLISFAEVRGGGRDYFPSFEKRAIKPLLRLSPEKLIAAGQRLGGLQTMTGDAAVTIKLFPFVPVTYVLWLGDDELPPAAGILFDENINAYLSCEDVAVAASLGTYALLS